MLAPYYTFPATDSNTSVSSCDASERVKLTDFKHYPPGLGTRAPPSAMQNADKSVGQFGSLNSMQLMERTRAAMTDAAQRTRAVSGRSVRTTTTTIRLRAIRRDDIRVAFEEEAKKETWHRRLKTSVSQAFSSKSKDQSKLGLFHRKGNSAPEPTNTGIRRSMSTANLALEQETIRMRSFRFGSLSSATSHGRVDSTKESQRRGRLSSILSRKSSKTTLALQEHVPPVPALPSTLRAAHRAHNVRRSKSFSGFNAESLPEDDEDMYGLDEATYEAIRAGRVLTQEWTYGVEEVEEDVHEY